ncbi:MAG: putative selenate reductase subunit YgfK [Candidatus Cloacimonas sp. 4484_140]|nr:MAG: putative selenate reductase subunit YgfK [Candidatus Cloacimonas sp. 4484_140]
MTDKMIPLSFEKLLYWIFQEYEQNKTIFGIHDTQFYHKNDKKFYKVLNASIEEPIGPAAGPHTQLAQNIIVSYLCGGRFFELKTVQKLDELEIEKPCIDAPDEGYNTEWSTELTVSQAYGEYLKAWFVIHLLKEVFKLSTNEQSGFLFNMSVGYDLEGIKTKKIDDFIEHLKNAERSPLFNEYKKILRKFSEDNSEYSKIIEKVLTNISTHISDSITLSTMHGCPPHEIESICEYLITEKKLHTFVKLNPTLLGYEKVRNILDAQGFLHIALNRESFEKDLQFEDAIPMLKRLARVAESEKRNFGVKLSNTLAVINQNTILPSDEKYMSGRALYPITINLSAEISKQLEGKLPISFSGGASYWNIIDILETGIKPITIATDLLKPGGYVRLKQLAETIEEKNIPDHHSIQIEKLTSLAEKAIRNEQFSRKEYPSSDLKIEKKLPLLDCFISPCKERCPIHQDVPEYILAIELGNFEEALQIIFAKNPLPNITGYICDHQCQTKCARWNYEQSVSIRELKKIAAGKNETRNLKFEIGSTEKKVAILGAGPAGLSAAYFLRRYGFEVHIFDKGTEAGGTVQNIIPRFRIPDEVIKKDVGLLKEMGVNFHYNYQNQHFIQDFQSQKYDYIFIGIGAHIPKMLSWCKDKDNIFEALSFLENLKEGRDFKLGKKIAVIGGGNSAMDAARAAIRVQGVEKVSILYRRTREYMPADKEEFDNAIKDGVNFKELINPIDFTDSELLCQKMELGEMDKSGRRKPIPIENVHEKLEFDSVIMAIGEEVDKELLKENNIEFDEKGNIFFNSETLETSLKNVYIGGDALRGPSTVVESIADGKQAAEAILIKEGITFTDTPEAQFNKEKRFEQLIEQQGYLRKETEELQNSEEILSESSRCLQCDFLCAKCVEVCPNKANVLINLLNEDHPFKNDFQIIHIDDFCNECGNCITFCPYKNGKPYKDKFTLFHSEESFKESTNDGVIFNGNFIKLKYNDEVFECVFHEPHIKWNSVPNIEIIDLIEFLIKKIKNSYLI